MGEEMGVKIPACVHFIVHYKQNDGAYLCTVHEMYKL